MATTFDSSLFGGTALPADLQRQLDEKQAMEFAQLTPSQQLGNLGFRAGRAIGRGLGEAFGVDVQDPIVKQATMLRQLSQGLDLKTEAGLNQYADRLMANNLPAQAAQIAQMSREAGLKTAETSLKTAQAKRAESYQQAQADKTQVRNLLADVETRLANNEPVSQIELNKAKLAYQEKGQPVDHFDPTTQTIVRIPGIDMSIYPNLTQAFGKAGMAATGGPKVASTIETPASIEAKTSRANSFQEGSIQLDALLTRIGDTEKLISPWSTQWGAKFLDTMPGSDALTLKDNTNTIKNNIAITKLQELKDKSKTGASGLGQLSDKDMATVKELIANLNPMSSNYANDLKDIKAFFVRAKKAMQDEARLTQEKVEAVKPSGMYGKNPQIKDTEGAWLEKAMKLNPDYTRAQAIQKGIEAGKLPAGYQ